MKKGSSSSSRDCTVDDLVAYRKVAKIISVTTVTDHGDLGVISFAW